MRVIVAGERQWNSQPLAENVIRRLAKRYGTVNPHAGWCGVGFNLSRPSPSDLTAKMVSTRANGLRRMIAAHEKTPAPSKAERRRRPIPSKKLHEIDSCLPSPACIWSTAPLDGLADSPLGT
jgi:hypothetical protein